MARSQGHRERGTNHLLALLPPTSRQRLQPLGTNVELPFGQVLIGQGEPIEHVYFPSSGVVSLVVLEQDGRGVDTATTGFDGMVGASLVLGDDVMPYEATVQVEGEALRIPAARFREVLGEDDALRSVLLRYVELLLIQASRSAACYQLHDVEQRLARWLLQIHDWVGHDHFHLTQEFLATMLGARRATITVAARTLQHAGLITYRRGAITIVDRQGLEDVACEDYVAIRDAFERLLNQPRGLG